MDKKADYKYGLLLNLILGLIILGISLYFIFTEFVIEEDINYEVCRQSVVLREQAMKILGNKWGISDYAKGKMEEFPFKCQASHKEIDYEDYDRAGIEIMDAMASCYNLYGEGKYELYADDYFSGEVMCFQCYRISFAPEVRDFYSPKDYVASEKIKNISDKIKEYKYDIVELYPSGIENLQLELDKSYQRTLDVASWEPEWDQALEEWSELKKIFEKIAELKLEIKKLELEVSKLEKITPESNRPPFKWKSYLTNKMRGTDMTYQQFLYGEKNEKRSTDAIHKSSFIDLYDSSNGDIIITFLYQIPAEANKFWSNLGSSVFTYQTNQANVLGCDVYETIPA